eukprot:TRINITY_DN87408_c0_g1_i1.p1 TRINITY_DN87408_c0_g1~~TRINITY_DN87408_c0_g1_i1.p1  ORF type:complete len:391 (-),score=65.01 TRINITY_DN87408_c0_g1_i1:159-1331(-)
MDLPSTTVLLEGVQLSLAVASVETGAEVVLTVWASFVAYVLLLIGVDAFLLSERTRSEVSIATASKQCSFWIITGLLFNAFIWRYLGAEEGLSWLSGYVLEYMLSVDNLFCFHLIFSQYRTPKDQVHRALFYGIGGAVLLRLVLFTVGATMFNFTFALQLIFGAILLYSGFKVMAFSDDDDASDYKDGRAVKCLSKIMPIHDGYAPQAAFFMWTSSSLPDGRDGDLGEFPGDTHSELSTTKDGQQDVPKEGSHHCPAKASLLCLVVITLWLVDLIFAVDSVTAKVSMVSQFDNRIDLVLNFTSSAFTMLTQRSLYFLVASLVHYFQLMKYGVGLVLILIGLRLMLPQRIILGDAQFCALMLGIFVVSLLASVVQSRYSSTAVPETAVCLA